VISLLALLAAGSVDSDGTPRVAGWPPPRTRGDSPSSSVLKRLVVRPVAGRRGGELRPARSISTAAALLLVVGAALITWRKIGPVASLVPFLRVLHRRFRISP